MGDRTSHSLTIFACPEEEQARAVLAILKAAGYVGQDVEEDVEDFTLALGGLGYVIEEAYVGGTAEVVADLVEQAPGIVFEAYEDAKYGDAGEVFRHAPELGTWRASYAGEDLYSLDGVRAILAAETREERDLLMGEAHRAVIAVHEERLKALDDDDPARFIVVHANYPHFPGRLHDCDACEAACYCKPGETVCVYEGPHNGTAEPVGVGCRECGAEVDDNDPHAGHGMCGGCLHDALRSGWTPGEDD